MKIKSLYSFLLATALVACNEDFNEGIAGVQTCDPEEAAATINFSASVVSSTGIDLGELSESASLVKVCSFTPATASEGTTVSFVLDIRDAENNSYKVDLNENGEAPVAQLQEIVETVYNKRPVERTFDAYVFEYLDTDGQKLVGKSEKLTLILTPKAPVIEEAYYFIGTTNNWTPGDKSLKFNHSGKDVYEDSKFTITVKAPYVIDPETEEITTERADQWFKIVPQSAMDAFDAGGADAFWPAGLLGTDLKEGDDRLEAGLKVNGGSFKQPGTDGAKAYLITLDMMSYTMTVEPLLFDEYVYIPGNHQKYNPETPTGWNPEKAPALYGAACDGIYQGYCYLDGDFKFTKKRTWLDGEYNFDSFTTMSEKVFSQGDGSNINAVPGFYQLKIDVVGKVLEATEITDWGVIGDATPAGWGDETELSYNAEAGCWEGTIEMTGSGEFKFRANHDATWAINLGGTIDNLTENGANIYVEEDGKYEIKLYTDRSTSDKIYCTMTKVE